MTFASREPGSYRDWIILRTSDEETRIPVAAGVSPTPSPGALLLPAAASEPEGTATLEQPASSAPSVKEVRVTHIGETSCGLEWAEPGGSVAAYEVQMRHLSLDPSRNLRIDWVPLAKSSIKKVGNKVSAQVKGLEQAMHYMLRVVALDTLRRPAPPSSDVSVFTKPKAPSQITFLRVFLFGLAVLLVGIVRERFFARR